MHVSKRKPGPITPNGKTRGRKPLDEKTYHCPVYLDVKCAQWVQREAHQRGISRSLVIRDIIKMEMKREVRLRPASSLELQMDMMAGSS